MRGLLQVRTRGDSESASGDLFADEHGFTTVGMALALLITLALLFTTAQVYRINAASAEVQDVADAAALAAENQVAEFMLVARTCDAVVLSLSLTAIVSTGLGVAALCTPVTAPLSDELIAAGKALFAARDRFSESAGVLLDKVQKALPFYAALCASEAASLNGGGPFGANYIGVAILLPTGGLDIDLTTEDSSEELVNEIESEADEIRTKAKEAEEAAEEANRAKERAWLRDCGDDPDYCMRERAGHLAGLSGSDNPHYASVDTWSFSVALERAQHYYAARLAMEAPANDSLDEQMRSALRTRYYRFAVEELSRGYVNETTDSFEANIPHLPSNTQEMRFTSLYTDEVYPVTRDEDDVIVVHAWAGCPEAAASLERCSIQYMESVEHNTCPTCRFTAASMGSVAAASTSIPNGFEYHYEAVADEAFLYEQARRKADDPKSEVKERAGDLFDKLEELSKTTAGRRVEVKPPGSYGAVAFVVNVAATQTAGGFASPFSQSGTLGPRAAVSAATLVDEGTEEGSTIISSFLDGMAPEVGAAGSALRIVLTCWSWMLSAYAEGQEALLNGIEDALNSLPLIGASGLGTWAADELRDAIGDAGLEPAELGALKPLLVNSAHVAGADDGPLAQGLLSIKQVAIAHPSASTDLFSSVLAGVEAGAVGAIEDLGDSVEIARIELGGPGGATIPIEIPLPPPLKTASVDAVRDLVARIREYYVEETGVRVWE